MANQATAGASTIVDLSGAQSIAGADVVRWMGSIASADTAAEIDALLAGASGTFDGGVLFLAYDSAGKVALY